ncbi:MAG: LEA type 2 family protein [Crocinitomicaceae bacterium]|jgi:LEA14-like dessication related protein|nr:LEA type 2 family protein [Crocinitomicaceae bacterium]
MIKAIAILSTVILLSSCTFIEPTYKGGEKFKFDKLEGKSLKFTVGAKILNPNNYTIKIKPSDLEVYIEDDFMGVIHLEKTLKLKKKQELFVDAPFTATLNDGALFKLLKFVTKGKLQLTFKGKVKGGVFIFSKKFDVNETTTIDGSNLRLR